jgi:hypothetical protein
MPQGYGNLVVSDLYEGIQDNLAGKTFANAKMAKAVKRTVLELSGSYPMQGLQVLGPFVRLQAANSQYLPSYFMQPGDSLSDLRMVNSFFMYYDQNISNPPPFLYGAANAGVQLTFQNMSSMENTLNTTSIPNFWSAHAAKIYIAPVPQYAYLTYMRYQKEHPFSDPVVDNDPLLFDDDWQDVLEVASAYRLAIQTRLLDYAQQLRNILYGDPKAVDAGGERIDLGLIYSRTSQFRRYQNTALRSLRKRSY